MGIIIFIDFTFFKLLPCYYTPNPFSILSFPQKAALDLGVLTEQEFHELVVPEKMIGPSD